MTPPFVVRSVMRSGRELRVIRAAGQRAQQRDELVKSGKPDEAVDDARQCRLLAAEKRGNEIELKKAHEAPVHGAHDDKKEGNNIDGSHVLPLI